MKSGKLLVDDLVNWEDHQLSIFIRAIHGEHTDRINLDWVFGYIFTILNDLEDCDCLIQDLYILLTLKSYDLELLRMIKRKNRVLMGHYSYRGDSTTRFNEVDELLDELIDSKREN